MENKEEATKVDLQGVTRDALFSEKVLGGRHNPHYNCCLLRLTRDENLHELEKKVLEFGEVSFLLHENKSEKAYV